MAEESPIIEEPKKPEEGGAETEAKPVDIDALMQTLEKFDTKDPQKLEGRLRNAQDYANMRSERDQFANELAALRAEILASRKEPVRESTGEYESGKPIDIEDVMSRVFDKKMNERDQKMAQHQQRMNDAWVRITSHPKFHLVKDEFEEALKDPATVMKLQTGQVDYMQFYYDMVVDKYAGVTRQMIDTVKQMKGAPGVKPPHVESGARAPGSEQDTRTEKQKKADELLAAAKKRPTGLHEDEKDQVIDAALGDLFR